MPNEIPQKQILFQNSPLWSRAPSRDDKKCFSDFMMLLPKFSKMQLCEVEATTQTIQSIVEQYAHVVVYADINTKLNVLWVSHQSIPGVSRPIIAAILEHVPGSKIVGTGYENFDENAQSQSIKRLNHTMNQVSKKIFKKLGFLN